MFFVGRKNHFLNNRPQLQRTPTHHKAAAAAVRSFSQTLHFSLNSTATGEGQVKTAVTEPQDRRKGGKYQTRTKRAQDKKIKKQMV